jgi:DNA-binding LytR/AlgR family response regulator
MDPIRAIIADDEAPLRASLKKKLASLWPDLVICGEAEDGFRAAELIEERQPNVAFLDIRMPGDSGIEVARKTSGMCHVVFITAYDEYAVDAFESEAIDYILKPVTEERLKITIRRLQKRISSMPAPSPGLKETMERVLRALESRKPPARLQWIKVQHGDGVRLIPAEEICYFQSSDKYTIVMTKEGESLIKKSITSLSKELDPDTYWQIHRGTIVNVNQIDKVHRSFMGRQTIKLKNRPETLTVSRSYSHLFKQM